ncbi:MAG: ABC transporter ATP-binding protein [Gammaproteobacteria bacterium]|nr:ABC transporter ATP-binding protein [Gammaproteobacteria bacterium]
MSEVTQGEPPREKTRREREEELNRRSSGLDTRTDIGESETVRIIARSAMYIALFPWRYVTKFILKLGSYALPLALLPWPAKMLVDHVILSEPLPEMVNGSIPGYPPYWEPVIVALYGTSPLELAMALAVFGVVFVLTIGSYTGGFEDEVEANLAQGHDYATQVENKMHGGHSTAGGLYGWFEFKLNTRLTQALNHTLRSHLFSRIQALSITKLEDQRIGDSIYRVMYDTPQINEIFYEITHTPIMSTLLFAQALLTMLSAYPDNMMVAYVTIAVFPAWGLSSALFSRIVRRRGQAARAAGAITTATIEEGMDNVLAVQSLGGNVKEKKRFGDDSKESFFRHRMVSLLWIFIGQLSGVFGHIVFVWFSFYIISQVIAGTMTVGDYAAIFTYYGYMIGPAMALGWLWIRFQDNVAAMRRVFALMDQEPEAQLGFDKLEEIEEGVSFKNVGLVYPDGRRALDNITFDAKVGEIVAFVGPTGAGKTSLAYLVPRYHVRSEGEILIDAVDINSFDIESLREQVTYVFQETQLFSYSIRDNIRFGKQDATQEEVEHVAKIAGIHDFIQTLPEGYDTRLGNTNAKISVGQKQRISIARGLLRPAKILILDEPTSALDPETEQYLVSSLHEAAKDRLVIIIAHRLSTIAHADKIIYLDEGQIAEQGTHDELVSREDGAYRHFVELQTTATA